MGRARLRTKRKDRKWLKKLLQAFHLTAKSKVNFTLPSSLVKWFSRLHRALWIFKLTESKPAGKACIEVSIEFACPLSYFGEVVLLKGEFQARLFCEGMYHWNSWVGFLIYTELAIHIWAGALYRFMLFCWLWSWQPRWFRRWWELLLRQQLWTLHYPEGW